MDQDEIYSTAQTIENWEYIAKWYGESLPEEGQYQARSVPRRVDKTFVSNETIRRICKLSALDYCCLNLPLPPECNSDDLDIFCALEENKRGAMSIQPWFFPHQISRLRRIAIEK